MNPTLERQLARARMRLARTPLPGFFAWWGGQLLACLPERWRRLLSERSESLLLDLAPGELLVWREKGDKVAEFARISRDQPAEAQAAEFGRLRAGIDDPALRTVFMIPPGRVLTRVLSLPAAAEENLRQVLAFEMDRQTPFKADQVYFDARVVGHDASGRSAQVELVLIPRAQLDQELGALPVGAAALDGVDSWRAEPGNGRRHANLLPADRRARRRNMRLPLNLGLAALAVVLLVVNMDESIANRSAALETMRVEVEQANTQARQVAALKKTLAESIAGANFLTERKRREPLTVALINDLTVRIPEDTYLERLQIENGQVQLQGQANEAARLIALLGESPCLGNPGFQGQVQPDARTGKERFQITADLKECSPATATPAGARPAAAVPAKPVAPPAGDATPASAPAAGKAPAKPAAKPPAGAQGKPQARPPTRPQAAPATPAPAPSKAGAAHGR